MTVTNILHLANVFVLWHLWSFMYSFFATYICFYKSVWSVKCLSQIFYIWHPCLFFDILTTYESTYNLYSSLIYIFFYYSKSPSYGQLMPVCISCHDDWIPVKLYLIYIKRAQWSKDQSRVNPKSPRASLSQVLGSCHIIWITVYQMIYYHWSSDIHCQGVLCCDVVLEGAHYIKYEAISTIVYKFTCITNTFYMYT